MPRSPRRPRAPGATPSGRYEAAAKPSPPSRGGAHLECHASPFACRGPPERGHRQGDDLARAHRRRDQRRQCRGPVRLRLELERPARDPVVPVLGDLPAVRRLRPEEERAHSHRRHLRPLLAADAALDRRVRVHRLLHADGDDDALAVVAGVHERLELRRDVRQPRRTGALAGAPAASGGLSSCCCCRESPNSSSASRSCPGRVRTPWTRKSGRRRRKSSPQRSRSTRWRPRSPTSSAWPTT